MRLLLSILIATTGLNAADIRLPKFTKETLPNGVIVYLMPKASVPLVNFRVVIKGGYGIRAGLDRQVWLPLGRNFCARVRSIGPRNNFLTSWMGWVENSGPARTINPP